MTNKAELIDAVAEATESSKAAAGAALDAVIDAISAALAKGEEVRLVGFGTFSVKARAAGKGRNPATGEEIRDSRVQERPLQARRAAEERSEQISSGRR